MSQKEVGVDLGALPVCSRLCHTLDEITATIHEVIVRDEVHHATSR